MVEWDTLDTDRRDAATLAVFAVATILDDSRFLRWAADRVDALAAEFEFAHASDVEEAERVAMTPVSDARPSETQATEPRAMGRNEAGPAEGAPGADVSDVIQKWKQTCAAVAECVATLVGDPPRPERLHDLRKHVLLLEQLHDPVVAFLEASRPQNLVAIVADTVATLADEHDAPWLGRLADQIHAKWKLTYLAARGVDAEQLREDAERVRRELKMVVSQWRAIERARQDCQDKLHELEESTYGPGEVLSVDDRRVALLEKVSKTARAGRDARLAIIRVVAPQGQDFDPRGNYKQQLEDASVSTLEPREHDVVQEPVGHSGTESRDAVEADTVPAVQAERVPGGTDETPAAANDDKQRAIEPEVSSDAVDESVEEETTEPGGVDGAPLPVPDPTQTAVHGPAVDAVAAEGAEDVAAAEDGGESGDSDSQDTSAVAVLWRAVEGDRPGIAYHIARLLTSQGNADPAMPPADLIAASVLADHVQSADSEVVRALRPLLECIDLDSLSRDDWRNQDAINLLLFGAALRPALLAPSTCAGSLLRRVNASSALAPVYDLATVVADHADRLQGLRLDATLFSATLRGAWQDEFKTFIGRVDDWSNKARSRTNLFQRASRVWNDLLSGDGCLARLVALISGDDENARDEIQAIREQIDEQKAFNKLVRNTDRSSRKGNPIQGRALKQLWDHVQPAIDLSIEWLRLMTAKPGSKDFVGERIEALRRDLVRHGGEAIATLDRASEKETAVARTAALKHARNTVDALLRIFSDDTFGHSVTIRRPDVIRSRDLLYVTELDLDADFRPADRYGTAAMLDLLLNTGAHAGTLRAAFDARLGRGDLIGAQLVCNRIDEEDDPDAEECRTLLDREVDRQRAELQKALTAKEERLENAFCRGQLGDERDDMAARLAEMRRLVQLGSSTRSRLDVVDAIARARAGLDQIQQTIDASSVETLKFVLYSAGFKQGRLPCHADTHWHHSRSPTSSRISSAELLTRPPCPTPWCSGPA